MTNPWLKKNPFMSLWLSGANAVAGSLRGHATAQAKRESTRAMNQLTKDMLAAWTVGWPAPTRQTRKRKRR